MCHCDCIQKEFHFQFYRFFFFLWENKMWSTRSWIHLFLFLRLFWSLLVNNIIQPHVFILISKNKETKKSNEKIKHKHVEFIVHACNLPKWWTKIREEQQQRVNTKNGKNDKTKKLFFLSPFSPFFSSHALTKKKFFILELQKQNIFFSFPELFLCMHCI